MRVRWSTLVRWVAGGLGVLLALQALPPLLRPPPPEPLAADIGLPRVRASKPATPPPGVARVSPARALRARSRPVERRQRRPATGDERPIVVEAPPPPAPPPVTPAPPPAPPPPPADGSVEFMPH